MCFFRRNIVVPKYEVESTRNTRRRSIELLNERLKELSELFKKNNKVVDCIDCNYDFSQLDTTNIQIRSNRTSNGYYPDVIEVKRQSNCDFGI